MQLAAYFDSLVIFCQIVSGIVVCLIVLNSYHEEKEEHKQQKIMEEDV